MLETVSEFAILYLKVGAILGFGLGTVAQFLPQTRERWGLYASVVLTLFWPFIIFEAVFGKK
jgi:cytochrome c biogenesis protein CcdA